MSWALFLQAIELILCGNHIYDVFFASTNFLFLIMGELTWNFYSWLNKLLGLAQKHHLSSPSPTLYHLCNKIFWSGYGLYFDFRIQNYLRIMVVLSLVSLKSKNSTGIASFSLKVVVNQGDSASQGKCISWNRRPRFFETCGFEKWEKKTRKHMCGSTCCSFHVAI